MVMFGLGLLGVLVLIGGGYGVTGTRLSRGTLSSLRNVSYDQDIRGCNNCLATNECHFCRLQFGCDCGEMMSGMRKVRRLDDPECFECLVKHTCKTCRKRHGCKCKEVDRLEIKKKKCRKCLEDHNCDYCRDRHKCDCGGKKTGHKATSEESEESEEEGGIDLIDLLADFLIY